MTKPETGAVSMGQVLRGRKGLTLLASLVLLIAMSMIGVVAVNMAVQEMKIAQGFESSVVSMAWAEAGIQVARRAIVTSTDPDMEGYSCDAANPGSTHWYPDETSKRVQYCIKLIAKEIKGDREGRVSAQEGGTALKTYFYKVDSRVIREDTTAGTQVDIRHIQTIETQTRRSI